MTNLNITARAMIDVQIYAVGGTGIDILRNIQAGNTEKSLVGMEHTSITFVDTSDSNCSTIDPSRLYRFPGLNGGGKNRKFIAEKALPHIPTLLERHKPKKVNIVVFGAGGASGAAAGPMLIGELIKRGHNVVSMVVGSASGSITEISNTVATIQTLSHFCKLYHTPLPIFYRQNDAETSLGMVDNSIRSALLAFCALFSNLNHGIEETDLKHFLNYTKTLRGASLQPSLVNLDYFSGDIEIPEHVQVLCQATLDDPSRSREDAYDIAFEGVVYRCTGELNEKLVKAAQNAVPINYLLCRGDMAMRLDILNRSLVQLEQSQAQRSEQVKDIETPMGGADDADMFY